MASTGPDQFASASTDDAAMPSDEELAELHLSVTQGIAQERGVVAALRSLKTPWRMMLAAGILVLAPIGMLLANPRSDLDARAAAIAAVGAGAALVLGLVVPVALRGFERRATKPLLISGLVALALLWPVGVAFVPQLSDAQWIDGAIFPHGIGCLARGLVMAVPALIVLRVLDRGAHGALANAAGAAAAAGLSAAVAASVGCAALSRPHVLIAHGAIVVVVVLGYVGLSSLRAAFPRR